MRQLLRLALVPVYMFAVPFLRLGLWVLGWVLGWALALAALGAWALAAGGEGSAWWRAQLFGFASGACHWLRSALPRRP
jgi:hypothetical protein